MFRIFRDINIGWFGIGQKLRNASFIKSKKLEMTQGNALFLAIIRNDLKSPLQYLLCCFMYAFWIAVTYTYQNKNKAQKINTA